MLGLVLMFIALFRRREAIGGWLLYFLVAIIFYPLTTVMHLVRWINRSSGDSGAR